MSSEDQLINRVMRKLPTRAKGLRIGIGDDAAVIISAGSKRSSKSNFGRRPEWVVTTDAFLENVHFLRRGHPPIAVGYKALARATSDLAAMGARPRYFLLTIALPVTCIGKWLDGFLDGMALAARRFGLTLVGGDTTKYPAVLVSLTVIGEVDSGEAILRSGARPGDLVCVSGTMGEAELGLGLVLTGLHKRKQWNKLLSKHLYPEPRLALGRWLAKGKRATAMIDTSDGFSTDLGHLCKASGVGARIWTDKIPVVRVPPKLQQLGLDPLQLALHGGEDYELLFAVSKAVAARLPKKVAGVPVTIIGEITRREEITLLAPDGQSTHLHPGGWDPFRKP